MGPSWGTDEGQMRDRWGTDEGPMGDRWAIAEGPMGDKIQIQYLFIVGLVHGNTCLYSFIH